MAGSGRQLRRQARRSAGINPTAPWRSGSRCPGTLWGCCSCAFKGESISTPTPSDSPPLASRCLGSRWSRPGTLGKGKVQGKG